MRTLHGTIRYSPLEGGLWLLETTDGESFQLDGISKDAQHEGLRVTAIGKVDDEAFGFGMSAPIFKVKSLTIERP